MEQKKTINIPNKWKTTDTRFVAFLDILGFKDKVMRKSHAEIYEELSKISKLKDTVENRLSLKNTEKFYDADVYVVSFSDSIVIFSKNDSFENFEYFLVALRGIFANSIRHKIAMKGGFAHGEISLNKTEQIYFGQPIIDAYLIEEDVNYLGVVAHSSINDYLHINKSSADHSILVKSLIFEDKINLKSGKIMHLNLDWFILTQRDYDNLKDEEKLQNIIAHISSFYCNVSGSPRRYIDNTIDLLQSLNTKGKINYKRLDFKQFK